MPKERTMRRPRVLATQTETNPNPDKSMQNAARLSETSRDHPKTLRTTQNAARAVERNKKLHNATQNAARPAETSRDQSKTTHDHTERSQSADFSANQLIFQPISGFFSQSADFSANQRIFQPISGIFSQSARSGLLFLQAARSAAPPPKAARSAARRRRRRGAPPAREALRAGEQPKHGSLETRIRQTGATEQEADRVRGGVARSHLVVFYEEFWRSASTNPPNSSQNH